MLSYDISAFNLAARALSLLTRGFELVTPGFKVTICRFELIIRGFKLITHRFELATHVLLFHNNTLYKITCIFFSFLYSIHTLKAMMSILNTSKMVMIGDNEDDDWYEYLSLIAINKK